LGSEIRRVDDVVGEFQRREVFEVAHFEPGKLGLRSELLSIPLSYVLQNGNGIGDRGAEMIGEGLKVNSSLRELYLVRLFSCSVGS
jgi:hypothetical protein